MFDKIAMACGIFALLVFAHAQQQGWSLFENVANAGHGGTGGSSRIYHK